MKRILAAAALCGAAFGGAAAAPPVEACAACHGRDGISVADDIPHLAGQRRAYLLAQLKAFRDGSRPHELMGPIARQLSEADLPLLAEHWSAMSPRAAGTPAPRHPAQMSAMVLPADFPAGFTEYAREQDAESRTTTLRYANAVALAAGRAGTPLPEGSAVIVVAQDAAGRVLSYSGMASGAGWGDAIPPLLRNANWNYGLWNAQRESRLGDLQPRCLACHLPQATNSHVFTVGQMRR